MKFYRPIRGKERDNTKWRMLVKAVPPEIWEKYGDFTVHNNRGYLYAKLPVSKRPSQFRKLVHTSIGKLVYIHHNPTHRFLKGEKVLYIDKDKWNNTIENLRVRDSK